MKKELIVHRNPKSPIAEIFRTLRTNIQFMNSKKKLKTFHKKQFVKNYYSK